MADRLAILETLHRAAWGYDTATPATIEDCFTEDAVMAMRIQGGGLIGPFEGRAAIMTMMRDALDSQDDQRRHVITNERFEDEHDTAATATSYLTLVAVAGDTLRVCSSGYYRDEVVLDGDAWRIRNRFLALDLPY